MWEKVLKIDRPYGQRVLRFDGAFGGDEYMPPLGGSAAGGSENRTTGPAARWKCTPIPLRGLLLKGSMSLDFRGATLLYKSSSFATPVGEVLATLSLEMLMSSKAERR